MRIGYPDIAAYVFLRLGLGLGLPHHNPNPNPRLISFARGAHRASATRRPLTGGSVRLVRSTGAPTALPRRVSSKSTEGVTDATWIRRLGKMGGATSLPCLYRAAARPSSLRILPRLGWLVLLGKLDSLPNRWVDSLTWKRWPVSIQPQGAIP